MIIKEVTLETVCGITSKLPDNTLDEIAFAGRSNVGKSSLINAIMNRKALARISSSPGKTQTINFYNVNNAFYLVDLPGYGYATASLNVKAQWGKMIENYLNKSNRLKTVFLLLDIRHKPTGDDKQMYDWIKDRGIDTVIIATKSDKLKRSQYMKHIKVIKEALGDENVSVIMFSSKTKDGREDIYKTMSDRGLC